MRCAQLEDRCAGRCAHGCRPRSCVQACERLSYTCFSPAQVPGVPCAQQPAAGGACEAAPGGAEPASELRSVLAPLRGQSSSSDALPSGAAERTIWTVEAQCHSLRACVLQAVTGRSSRSAAPVPQQQSRSTADEVLILAVASCKLPECLGGQSAASWSLHPVLTPDPCRCSLVPATPWQLSSASTGWRRSCRLTCRTCHNTARLWGETPSRPCVQLKLNSIMTGQRGHCSVGHSCC